jgi:hypothetical protein
MIFEWLFGVVLSVLGGGLDVPSAQCLWTTEAAECARGNVLESGHLSLSADLLDSYACQRAPPRTLIASTTHPIHRAMSGSYKTLDAWVQEMLAGGGDENRKCTAIGCHYENPTGGTKEVLTMPLAGKSWDAKDVFRTLKGRAEEFVQDRGGVQNFHALAFFDGSEVAARTHHFIVADGELKSGGAGRVVTESASAQGALSQMMRHFEHVVNVNADLVKTMAASWMIERREMLGREKEMRAELQDANLIVLEHMGEKVQQGHTFMMERLKYERATQERKLLIDQGPSLLAMAAGQEPPPAADTKFVEEVARKVSPEQIDMLVGLGVIDDTTASLFKVRVGQIRDRLMREAAETKRLPMGGSTEVTDNVTSIMKAKKDGGGQGGTAAPVTPA